MKVSSSKIDAFKVDYVYYWLQFVVKENLLQKKRLNQFN